MARTPIKSPAKPAVDAKEPLVKTTASSKTSDTDTEAQSSDDARDKGASGGDDASVSDADNAGGGDGVTGKTNDGATMASRDGSTGTPNAKSAAISTKEGDAPQGVERDTGFADTAPSGPTTQQQAAMQASMPAGTLVSRGAVNEVAKETEAVTRKFAALNDDEAILGTSNIHDDLGIQRAQVLDYAAAVESEFGIDITPSEAQNFLLYRDVVNLVLRKLAAKRT